MLIADYEFEIEKSKDGGSVLRIERDDKKTYIGSKYNNDRECDKFLELIRSKKYSADVFVIYGFGTGEHIKRLRNKYSNRIVVFEPNVKLFKYSMKLNWVKKDSKLVILCCEKDSLIMNLKKVINDYNYKNSEYLSFSNYNKVYRSEAKQYYKILNEFISNLALDVNTKLHFSRTWFDNLLFEIPYVVQGIPSDLYNNKYKNKPAVIVSAGPSLMKNIAQLKKVNGGMMIVSGGRTLSALIQEKIDVDLLVIADSTERNYTLVKDYVKNISTPLLFSESANLKIVKEHSGLKIFYTYSDIINRISGKRISNIFTGGSVAHAMTSYACNLGCSPIIFIGQDFAYTNNKSYSSITENKDGTYKYDDVIREDDIYVDDIFGEKVRTSLVLDNQRRAMEKIIKLYPSTVFINATEGGAKIEGTVNMSLNEAIEKYKVESFEKFKKITYNINMIDNAKKELNCLKHQVEELYELIESDILKKERNYSKNYVYNKIMYLYENNNEYKLLLYNVIYNFLKTSDDENKIKNKSEFYMKILEALKHAIFVINNQIEVLH